MTIRSRMTTTIVAALGMACAAALANLTALRFRAEFSVSTDAARLDNVVLASFLVKPPETIATCLGATVTFSVTASNGVAPYTYQWRKDGDEIGHHESVGCNGDPHADQRAGSG